MAHFAELDSNNTVINIIVISNFEILDINGVESEAIGIAKAKEITGSTNEWVQTSYNNNFKKQFGAIGFTYDNTNNVFIEPQPYSSWTLDENYDWQPPTAKPDDDQEWFWVEDELKWGYQNAEGEWTYNE